MKKKFDAYVLKPLAKKDQNGIVDRSTARYFTVLGRPLACTGYLMSVLLGKSAQEIQPHNLHLSHIVF